MSLKLLSQLRGRLRAEAASDPHGTLFYKVALTLAVSMLVLSLVATGRIVWALEQGTVWMNYRGSVLSREQLFVALGLSMLTALGSVAMVLLVRRGARKR